uniref:U4-like protein n=1 Tax=Glypta fumiferanae TaxID=389681 RepID=A0A0F6QA69_9HYME|nr:U4-like protein [Glypta fumiferanae]
MAIARRYNRNVGRKRDGRRIIGTFAKIVSNACIACLTFISGRKLWTARTFSFSTNYDKLLEYRRERLKKINEGFGFEDNRGKQLMTLLDKTEHENFSDPLTFHLLFPYMNVKSVVDDKSAASSKL